MKEKATEQDHNFNPTGKGGFADNPQNRNAGGRPKNQQSFMYWMCFFKDLTVEDFKNYENTHPEDKMFVAESIAYARVASSRKDLAEFKEVANRTEGMPKQSTDVTSGGEKINSLYDFLAKADKENTEES